MESEHFDTIKGPVEPLMSQFGYVSVPNPDTVPASQHRQIFSDSLFGPFIYPWGP